MQNSMPVLELGEVIDVADPEALNRVLVRFLSRGPAAGSANNRESRDATAWALVAVPFAGDGMGAFMIPDLGARVVLSCLNNDPRYPVVLGSIWDGTTASPETLGGAGDEVDRWSMTGKAGTRIAIVEESGRSKVEIRTPGGRSVVIDDGAGRITLRNGGSTVAMSPGEISLTSTTISIEASSFKVKAPTATYDSVISDFSGFVFSDLTQTNTIIASTYTPGAGNML